MSRLRNTSIIVSSDHLCGEIKLQKKDNKINVFKSSISKIITNNYDSPKIFNSLDEIIETIKSVIDSMCFSSRFIGFDMYTNKKYDDNEILSRYIYGIGNLYSIPHGIVLYHESNELLFCCTNIEFMLSENIIPYKYTNLDISKIYKVERSNGDIQDTVLLQNGGLVLYETENEKKIKLINIFSNNKEDKIDPIFSPELNKMVLLDKFLKLNNIEKFNINIPKLSKELKTEYESPYSELVEYYNNKLDEFTEKVKEYNIIDIN